MRTWQNDERQYLMVALLSSLAMHLVAIGLWLAFGFMVAALNRTTFEELRAQQEEARRQAQIEPQIFVEVLPEQATQEAPDETKFYSAASSVAANPDPDKDTGTPRVDGTQDLLVRAVDNPRPQFDTLQRPPPAPVEEPAEEIEEPPLVRPVEPEPVGDLAMVRPTPVVEEPPARPRPTRLSEVRAQRGLLAGERMRQDGGVRRPGHVAFNVKATPFGEYDGAIIRAIEQRWYGILDESAFVTRSGKVVVEFRIHYDGRVTDLKVVEQDVGELLSLYCRRAISDPAPFGPWPSDMRRMVGRDYRDVRFTFHYM
jgi:hypothetical protein